MFFNVDFSENISFKINNTLYQPGDIKLDKDEFTMVECVSEANPSVACYMRPCVIGENAENSCFYTVNWNEIQNDTCILDCFVSNFIDGTKYETVGRLLMIAT